MNIELKMNIAAGKLAFFYPDVARKAQQLAAAQALFIKRWHRDMICQPLKTVDRYVKEHVLKP